MRFKHLKIALTFFLAVAIAFPVFAVGNHSVRGHAKKNGKYVVSHRQTNPNRTQRDNWGAKGNTNPYIGKQGTKKATH